MNIWALSTRDFLRLLRAALLGAGAELAALALMATAAWLLLRAAEQPPLGALTVAIVGVRTLALLRGGLRYAERLAGHEVVLRWLGALRTRVYQALVPGSRFSGGDLVTRLVSDVDALQDAVLRWLLPAGVAALVGTSAVAITLTASVSAAIVLGAGLLVAGVLLPWLVVRITRRAAREDAPRRAELAERAVELVTGHRELVAAGALDEHRARATAVVDEIAATDRKASAKTAVATAAGTLVQLVTTVAVALLCHASVPWTAALTLAALTSFEVVLPLIGAARRVPEIQASAARVKAVLETPVKPTGTRRVQSGHFRLANAGVRYPGRAPALQHIDLDLPPGKRVGILGPSGAGKTTLLRLLLGSETPTDGQVLLDGHPLGEYADLPRIISGAEADAHIFHTTVRENLLLAKPDATDGELAAACATAGFDLGLDRETGPDGDALSGGQRQRLILARAVLADPKVLVLDEPVEGLDPAHGDAVLQNVLAHAKGTVVLVTHRPEHLAGFDEVLTLEDGRALPASAAGRRPARP
ncbi:ATP-binding cassette, subfamily C, CydC [Amycolatopsis pretoriensis]|uniref:ATP-binding cassette, subfamily C, CydC n=1 Tax=Amycolatopsis pretoriensis TaxID=218821 RepID=A0A1H5RDC4_9PSEU|nr:thiol reductant ABC exporter subunit CydC [Amycolatopsis pretoriensis]SEF36064.1 ATP-binding cassette, subfamily C, CydC [Amycolatopsis pretoriensis]